MGRKGKTKKTQCSPKGKSTLIKRNPPATFPPFDVDGQLQKAIQFHRSNQLLKAEAIYKRILHIDPNHADALHLLGFMAHQAGRNDSAADLIARAIRNNPQNAILHNHLGNALKDLGRFTEALSCYQKALELDPHYGEAYNNMGSAVQELGKVKEAISCYKKALRLNPHYDHALNNMGNACQDLGKIREAIFYYRKALEEKPDYAEALNNLGTALKDMGKIDEAICRYQEALRYRPTFFGALVNLGTALGEKGRADEAVSCYQQALEIRPDCDDAISRLFHQLQQMCAWNELGMLNSRLDKVTTEALKRKTKPAESPFVNISRSADPSRNCAVAKAWSHDIAERMSNLQVNFSFHQRKSPKERITLGYLSSDFRDHPVAHLLVSLFGLHDPNAFEIVCYCCGIDDQSPYRKRILKEAGKFVDLYDLGHEDAARRIWNDNVDILIELNGYTEGSRMGICALRPAPVQVSYLGFPGTTGANFIDYVIVDEIVCPADHAPWYAEHLVYMPHCYMVTDHGQSISAKPGEKQEVGLPRDAFVFCSFNQAYKIDKATVDLWIKILEEVPQGVLWLQQVSETAQRNLRKAAEDRGIQADRIVFAEKLPSKGDHLARLSLADLVLDTVAFNGHTTTTDALWAGIPVVTLQGSHFASRVSSSILTAIGLPELVTHSTKDYQALAIELATNPGALTKIQDKLLENRLKAPLFDTPRFVKNLEKAYKEMWKIFLSGKKPEPIHVVDDEPEGSRNPSWENNSSD